MIKKHKATRNIYGSRREHEIAHSGQRPHFFEKEQKNEI